MCSLLYEKGRGGGSKEQDSSPTLVLAIEKKKSADGQDTKRARQGGLVCRPSRAEKEGQKEQERERDGARSKEQGEL